MLFFGQLREKVGGIVGVHLLDDVGGAFGADILDEVLRVSASRCSNASAAVSSSSWPTTASASREERSPMISASSDGMESREPALFDRKPHVRRIDVANRRDRIPRDHRARNVAGHAESQRLPNERNPSRRKQSGDADVGGDDAQPAARVGDLDVVDAHDLAAVDVDDLLVEQIGDEIELLSLGRRGLLRRDGQRDGSSRSTSATVSIGANRRPCAVLMTSPSICGKRSSGLLTRKSATLPIGRSLTVARRPTSSEMNPSVNAIPSGNS